MMGNTRLNQIAIALFCLLVIAGFGWWFYTTYEPVTRTERSDMAPEARHNPLLAAQRLLERLGLQVESQSGRRFLAHPPEENGALLVRDLGAPLTQDQVDELLYWVEEGGHLIASPGRLQSDELNRPLLESFGVSLVRAGHIEGMEWLEDMVREATKKDEPATTDILLPGEGQQKLTVEFDERRWFSVDYDGDYWLEPEEDNPHLLQFAVGGGYVTFLSDSRFFDNEHIGDYDHAPLLAELTAGYDRVWLLYSSQMPSLAALLWRAAPYLVVSLGLLTLLLVWRMSRRTGPLILIGEQQRRNLLEHLQAAAEFNWRFGPAEGRLQLARKQVEKRWLASHPQLQRLEPAARCEWLAEHTGLSAESIELALYRFPVEGGQLVKTTANLQRLLTALHPQSNKR